MYQLTKISSALAALGLSTVLLMGQSVAATNDNNTNATNDNSANATSNATNETVTSNAASNTVNKQAAANNATDISPVTNGVSQKVAGNSRAAVSLNKFLPTIKYTTENLPAVAQKINAATWKEGTKIDRNVGTKLQALLNWNQNGVGAVDGSWGKNSRKAMQAFQMANGLAVTDTLNTETWQALTKNDKLMQQPVLVSYQLTDADINIKTTTIPAGAEAKAKLEGMYYETVIEGLAEKFHISENYLKALNPNAKFAVGETITVYNPGNPNTKPVSRVVADKATETLYAYDDKNNLVASYPTTVGSTATPSPLPWAGTLQQLSPAATAA